MYNLSTAFSDAARSNSRKILTRAIFNDEIELTGDNIMDMSVTEAIAASGGISMGTTIASKLEMTVKTPGTALLLNNGLVNPFIGFDGVYALEDFGSLADGIFVDATDLTNDGILVYTNSPGLTPAGILAPEVATGAVHCPLGKFYITEAKSNNNFEKTFKIVAYDAFSKTEETYSPTIAMPNTAQAILQDIAAQCNFSISSDVEYPAGRFDLYDFTCRQYIGYFAGLVGKNARFNRNGELAFTWYTDSNYQISREYQYANSFKRLTDADTVVTSITSGSGDVTLVAGNGAGFSFENPFMTQETLDTISAKVGSFSYTPAQLKWRGNPAIEAGDIVLVEEKAGIIKAFYVMEQTFKISGGMHSEIKCYGDSEAAISFSTSPTAKKIQQVYTKLQDAIRTATELLNGNNGGVFEITDGNKDGINDGWIIHSADGQRFIKATVDGIGITTDGGATYAQAMTAEGINASAITTGSLNAERIAVENYEENDPTKLTDYIRFGNGTITLGKGDSAIILKLENDQIAFYNTSDIRLGRFTNNSFEIDNLEEGQIRFQNFGFIPRASKNLSFTKLT
jgi:hypothetical protein